MNQKILTWWQRFINYQLRICIIFVSHHSISILHRMPGSCSTRHPEPVPLHLHVGLLRRRGSSRSPAGGDLASVVRHRYDEPRRPPPGRPRGLRLRQALTSFLLLLYHPDPTDVVVAAGGHLCRKNHRRWWRRRDEQVLRDGELGKRFPTLRERRGCYQADGRHGGGRGEYSYRRRRACGGCHGLAELADQAREGGDDGAEEPDGVQQHVASRVDRRPVRWIGRDARLLWMVWFNLVILERAEGDDTRGGVFLYEGGVSGNEVGETTRTRARSVMLTGQCSDQIIWAGLCMCF